LDKKHGRLLSKIFDYRQKGDYGDMYNFDQTMVIPLIDQVKEFISIVNQNIE